MASFTVRAGWWAAVLCAAQLAAAGAATTASAATGPPGDGLDLALVVPGDDGRSRVLRAGEPDFGRLRELLRPDRVDTEPAPRGLAREGRPVVRVTVLWGVTGVGGWPRTHRPPGGDVAMERLDQVVVAADGTPWVRSDPSPDVADDDIRWHRGPRTLLRDLERAGLPEAAPDGGTGTRPVASGGAGGAGGVWWVLPGLAAGAAGGFLGCRAAARRRAEPPYGEARQELIDL
ncbi:hypothetical protein [Streptomyces sp. NPDC005573]|uniref:hypothetical protein n=1 Tax=Streptomyces sp. NPDC005573 TaxID=3156890 RepID=UPI00339EDA22